MESINKAQFNSIYTNPEAREQISVGVDLKFLTELRWARIYSNPVKSVLLVAIALLFFGTTTQTASAQQRGEQGSQVRNIQRCLKRLGYFNARITGFYGSATEAAVTRFQAAVGLPRVGKVGPRTKKALDRRCGNSSVSRRRGSGLRNGSSGSAVRRLQQDLRILGYYNGPITGNFRELTEAAVIRFQRANGISAIGVVGPQTRRAIRTGLERLNNNRRQAPVATNPTSRYCDPDVEGLSVGCDGQWVRQLQTDLQSLRLFNGRVTGYFGQLTQNAVVGFQQSRGLRTTGIADYNTLNAIRAEVNRSYTPPVIPNPDVGGSGFEPIYEGARGNRVIQIQKRLRELGFFRNEPTGYFGRLTREAVADYQRIYRLPITGFLDQVTWEKLGLRVGRRYVVVVPVTESDTLSRVRDFVPDAFAAQSRRGDYVNAGEFDNVSDAQRRSKFLREQGLDARVEYL